MKKFIHKFVPSLLCVCLLFAYSLQFAPTVKAAEFSPRTEKLFLSLQPVQWKSV